MLDVEEDARDQDHRHEHGVDHRRRRLEVRDRVREGDAERGEAATPATREDDRAASASGGQPRPKKTRPARPRSRSGRRVCDRVEGEAAEVDAARQRRPAHPLEDPLLAQERQVVGERGERRRHHAHAGDPRDDDVELVVVAGDDRAEQREEDQRQQEVEERGARIAPEEAALEAVLAPEQRQPSGIGRQLQVDVLEARSRHRQPLEALAARERGGGQLVQQRVGSSVWWITGSPSRT